jgi:threonine dehydrogenase-like Zn-dependent dehydrogenase
VDVPTPEISAPEGILVKVERTAICGSDMPSFAYDHPASAYPMPPGVSIHECIGVVAASRSPRFKEGDRVLALPDRSNGLAEYFMSDMPRTIPLLPFSHKEQVLMTQPLGTVVWACRKLPNLLLKDAVVMGQGPMGLLMAHALSNLGAKTVVALDRLDYRLEASKRMRATHTVNVDREDAVEAVRRITDGRMADLVVEMVGHQQETVNTCLNLVKRGGTVLAFGVPDDQFYNVDFGKIIRQNITLIGSVGPDVQNDLPLAMDMIVQGRINVAPILTHLLPFDQVQRGFEMFTDRTDGAIKVVLNYDGAGP